MAQVINTNVASLTAQRNLNSSQEMLQTSLQRLSSGLRINSAKDDAAGLAISNRMTSQIEGMQQAARNSNDAISLAQTGEGGLQEVTNNLHRMRELGVQARNATNTDTDRESLDAEFQELLSEVNRIAETSSFNGQKVLDGSLGSAEFQVGADVGETISVDVSSSMKTTDIGNFASASFQLATDSTTTDNDQFTMGNDGDLTVNGVSIDAATDDGDGKTAGSAIQVAAAINAKSTDHSVDAKVGETTNTDATSSNVGDFSFGTDTATDNTYTLTINGTEIFQESNSGDFSAKTASELASAINDKASTTGVKASTDSDGNVTLTAADGRNIELQEKFNSPSANSETIQGYFGNSTTLSSSSTTLFTVNKAELTLESSQAIDLDFDTSATNEPEQLFGLSDGTSSDSTATVALDFSDLLSDSAIDNAINRVDQALEDVDTLRGTFGAIQSRFESTVSNLQTAAENVSAARSRIRDADFAQETAQLTKGQILQQAGTSMLAQANQVPQNVLSLLQ